MGLVRSDAFFLLRAGARERRKRIVSCGQDAELIQAIGIGVVVELR